LYFITERNKGRTANEILMDFHEQHTDFNDMFMKEAYCTIRLILNTETYCVKERKKLNVFLDLIR